MRHKVAGRKFDRDSAHRRAMYRNLVTDILRHEKIMTTEPKAKEIRGFVERMITLGKKGKLADRRRAASFILDEQVVSKVFDELATRYADRPGGYTRVVKIGPRLGDGAPMAKLELVE
jgi:large subunit ribosomal protein L17